MGILHKGKPRGLSTRIKQATRFLLVAVLWLCCNTVIGQHLLNDNDVKCIEQSALKYLGHEESPRGSNKSPYIKIMLRHVGVRIPAPWCAGFVALVLRDVCHVDYPHSGFVAEWSRGKWEKNIIFDKRKGEKLRPEQIHKGQIFTIYFANLKRDAHIGIILGYENGHVITIEGNTNAGGSRDGYAVCIKHRSLNSISKILIYE